jgi:CO/xanthine dehydrogenase Mo-binding subunit
MRWSRRSGAPRADGRPRHLGLAVSAHISGLLASGAIVRMLEDGSVLLNTGAVDIGQGSNTALTQICAQSLQLPVDRVAIASPDTDGSPYNWGTTASRVTYVTGRSVVAASDEVTKQLKRHAGEMLECSVDDLELRPGGLVAIKGVPDKCVSFAAISGRAHWAAGGPIIGSHSWVFDQKTVDPKRAVALGLPFQQIGIFSFSAMVVEVEVDTLTGKVSVPRAWSACDVGRAINPQMASGQIEGAFVQGMGFALTEEMVWDGARLANPSLMDYKIPTFAELPATLNILPGGVHRADRPLRRQERGRDRHQRRGRGHRQRRGRRHVGLRMNQLPMSGERVLNGMIAAGTG